MFMAIQDTRLDKKLLLPNEKPILPKNENSDRYVQKKAYIPSKEYVWIAPGEDGFHEEYDED